MTGNRKRTRRSILPKPAPPQPGRWKVMQRHGEAVIQWAWTCPACKVVEYVLCQPPRPLDMDGRRERCQQADCANRPSVWVEYEAKN